MEQDRMGELEMIYDLNWLRSAGIAVDDDDVYTLEEVQARRQFRQRNPPRRLRRKRAEEPSPVVGHIWHDGTLASIGRAVAMLLQFTHSGIDVIEWRRK
jgi:hypothetical protein